MININEFTDNLVKKCVIDQNIANDIVCLYKEWYPIECNLIQKKKQELIKKIEQFYDVKWEDIICKRDFRKPLNFRIKKIKIQQIYSYLCFTEFKEGCTILAEELNKHHTTILYNQNLIKDRLYVKDQYTTDVVNFLKSHLQK